MKLEMSFFNRGIFYNNFKGLGWFGIVYFLILAFSVPFQIFMIYSSRLDSQYYGLKKVFNFGADLQGFFILIAPVLLAILLFRYLQVKSSAVLIHSLPVKRTVLFYTHIITGLIYLVIPVVLTAFLAWVLRNALALNEFYTGADILQWLSVTLALNILFFLAAVFVGVATGLSTAQGVLTYILLFLPTGISLLVLTNLEIFLYGFIHDPTKEGIITRISPVFRLLEASYNKIQFSEVIGYLIASVIFLILAYFFYLKRKIEGASQTIVFDELKPIFKYGVTFCFMLVGGLYFREINYTKYWVLFGYLMGSLLGYLLAEIALKKSIRIFGNLKGYFYYIGAIILILTAINFDFTGYENKIPPLDKVESIYFGSDYFYIQQLKLKTENNFDQSEIPSEMYFDPENLKNIQKFHRQIVEDKDELQNSQDVRFDRKIIFAYQLKGGKKIVRGYSIPTEKYAQYFKPIHESIEYKEKFNPILKVKDGQVNKIIIRPNANLNKKAVIIDDIHIKEAVEILQGEIISSTYEEMKEGSQSWATLELMLSNDKIIHTNWNKSFTKFDEWLKMRGYWEDARLLPEDIEYAVVEKMTRHEDGKHVRFESKGKGLRVSDKEQLEECLQKYSAWDSAETQYVITFFTEGNNELYARHFNAIDLPGFAKEYFDNRGD